MRPVALTIEGFTCFKEKQGPIEFSKLDLFAISGPTGAGKSSILDAITFALYGYVPRMGKQGLAELISLGRDRMSVLLDFTVGEQRYRLARLARRSGVKSAQLEELAGETCRPLAEGVKNVDAKVQEILGLRYDAFRTAVVLPQGEFQRFLKSEPAERRQILRDLLRLQVYERMRQAANQEQARLGGRVQNLDERLKQEYSGVTAAALEDTRADLDAITRANKDATEDLVRRERALAELRAHREKTRELAQKLEAAKQLAAREPQMRELRERLLRAERAGGVMPKIKAAREKEKAAEEETERLEQARAALDTARVAHTQARSKLERASKAAEEIPALRERIARLDELKGVLEARANAEKRKRDAERQKLEAERNLASAERELEAASKRLGEAKSVLENAEAALKRVPYDKGLTARLDALREEAVELARVRQAMADEKRDADELEKDARQKEEAELEAKKGADHARRRLQQSEERYQRTEQAFREAEQRHAACVLRATLEAGKPCPVCQQPVAKLPRQGKIPELEELAVRRDEARAAVDRARSDADQAAARHAQAAAAAAETRRSAAAAASRLEKDRARVEKLEAQLQTRCGPDVKGEPGKTIETRILAALRKLAEARQQHERASEGFQRAQLAAQQALHLQQQASDKVTFFKERCRDCSERLRASQAELEDLRSRIAAVTQASDPLIERQLLAERVGEIEQSLKSAENEERPAAVALAAAERSLQERERAAWKARDVAVKARKEAHEAALEAGFADEDVAAEAELRAEEKERLQNDVDAHERETHATARRINELEGELGDRRVDEAELRAATNEWERLKHEHEAAIRKEAELSAKLADLERRLLTSRRLSAELEQARAAHLVYRQLADDLRTDKFQAYLLDEAFRELVRGASRRLMELSGRYTFDYHEDDFHVLDHDNAQERRSADTLSGGETFLASLCLALELSEQVQRSAGAVRLDSLFIDEGFGTLDPETLDVVAAAIQSLKVGGRMVGIITHIPELTAQLPERIIVEKRPEGSRVAVEVV